MVFKQIDFLSPQITLYNKRLLYHSSKISVILSIIAFIIILFSFLICFAIFFFKLETPKMSSYNLFVEDAGQTSINQSELFHFINIYKNSSLKKEFDFESFRIIGFNTYFDNYIHNRDLSKFDHWLYGPCNEINNLISEIDISNSACIKKYYNSKELKYININETNFRWPVIEEGTFKNEKKFYSLIIEKCEKNSLNIIYENDKKECKNDIELENTIKNGIIQFNFVDQEVKMENYLEPINRYFNRIETKLSVDNYLINHLYFNPVILNTTEGLIGSKLDIKFTYMFDRDNIYIHKNNNENFFIGYYLWFNKRMIYYNREYSKIIDFVSDIGGISNVIISIFYFINKLFNKYAMLTDTQEYFLSSSLPLKKNFSLKKEIKLKYLKTKSFKQSKSLSFIMEEKPIPLEKKNNSQYYNNKSTSENIKINSQSENINNKAFVNEKSYKYEDSNIILNNKRNNNINKKDDKKVNNNKIQKVNFCIYILNRISFGKLYSNLKIYEDFRIKVISVENLMNNYLNINNLIKVSYMKKNN